MPRHAQCPPHVSTPPRTGGLLATRVFTARAGSSPARRALTYARALRMTLGDIRFGPPSLLRSQPVVLSALSTGARLRRVPPISRFQPWRRTPFHSTDHSGHTGRIGQGSWRLPAIRSSFRRGSWRDYAQYIVHLAAHAFPNDGFTAAVARGCFLHA